MHHLNERSFEGQLNSSADSVLPESLGKSTVAQSVSEVSDNEEGWANVMPICPQEWPKTKCLEQKQGQHLKTP